jgi:hypothetical protein
METTPPIAKSRARAIWSSTREDLAAVARHIRLGARRSINFGASGCTDHLITAEEPELFRSSMELLPAELLFNIFQYIPETPVFMVCKRFYEVSFSLRFNEINCDQKKPGGIFRILGFLLKNPIFLPNVRKLSFTAGSAEPTWFRDQYDHGCTARDLQLWADCADNMNIAFDPDIGEKILLGDYGAVCAFLLHICSNLRELKVVTCSDDHLSTYMAGLVSNAKNSIKQLWSRLPAGLISVKDVYFLNDRLGRCSIMELRYAFLLPKVTKVEIDSSYMYEKLQLPNPSNDKYAFFSSTSLTTDLRMRNFNVGPEGIRAFSGLPIALTTFVFTFSEGRLWNFHSTLPKVLHGLAPCRHTLRRLSIYLRPSISDYQDWDVSTEGIPPATFRNFVVLEQLYFHENDFPGCGYETDDSDTLGNFFPPSLRVLGTGCHRNVMLERLKNLVRHKSKFCPNLNMIVSYIKFEPIDNDQAEFKRYGVRMMVRSSVGLSYPPKDFPSEDELIEWEITS